MKIKTILVSSLAGIVLWLLVMAVVMKAQSAYRSGSTPHSTDKSDVGIDKSVPAPLPDLTKILSEVEKLKLEVIQLKFQNLQNQAQQQFSAIAQEGNTYQDAVMKAHPELLGKYTFSTQSFQWQPVTVPPTPTPKSEPKAVNPGKPSK